MPVLGFGAPTPITRREEISFDTGGNPPRFFQKQKPSDGDCAIRSFNNAIGFEAITKTVLAQTFEKEEICFEKSELHCAIPGKKKKLLSATLLQRLMRRVGFKLSKIHAGRSPQNKFDCVLGLTKGRFLLVTMTDKQVQSRDGHDLNSRNHHHWIAVSADENLVIDSLARRLGPQILSRETLTRSVRDGILKIYEISESRLKS